MRDVAHEFYSSTDYMIGFLEQGENANMVKIGKSKRNIDVLSILEDPEFEGMISYLYILAQAANIEAFSLRKKMMYTLDLMVNEIR